MASWLWTKDLAVAVADPIEPLDEYDDRPSIKDLIQKHEKKIVAMKKGLEDDPLYEPNKHDDLWILRFLLSHKNKFQQALDAAKYTLAFRHKHQLDNVDVRYMQPAGPNSFINAMRLFSKHIQPGAMAYTVPDTQRGVVMFYHPTLMDTHKIVKEFEEHPHWLDYHMNMSEWQFQWNDYISRKTGRLTKCIMIINIQGLSLSGWNKEYQERNKRANEEFELCYPQRTGCFFAVNVPQWLNRVWKVLRVLFPKRVVEKVDAIDPLQSPQDKAKLLKYMSEGVLPERFGGSYEAWPVEYPNPEEETEEQHPSKRYIKCDEVVDGTIPHDLFGMECQPKGCKHGAQEKAPQKAKWRKRIEEGKIKNFLRRRRNGTETELRGDAMVERSEMPASTAYFSAPLACI